MKEENLFFFVGKHTHKTIDQHILVNKKDKFTFFLIGFLLFIEK